MDQPVWNTLLQLDTFFNSSFLNSINSYVCEGVLLKNKEKIFIGEHTKISEGVVIEGPCYVGSNCFLAPGAYIRPYTVLLDFSRVGHCSEIKSSILMPYSKAPHFNYVGDSILGNHVNLGAGVILANYKLDGSVIKLKTSTGLIDTGMNKFGSIVGDQSSLGCNSVLNPGTLLPKKYKCRALSSLSGILCN